MCMCAPAHENTITSKKVAAVVAEILLTVRVQRISTLPVAINFVFLISPIVSKKEKNRWTHSASRSTALK